MGTREADRKYYETHKVQVDEKNQKWWIGHPGVSQGYLKARYAKFRAIVDEPRKLPCADCGKSYLPCVMDYDHRPGEVKLFNISMAMNKPRKLLLEEIEKCDIVCANCHRIREYNRRSQN
jgi:hypothetical protein